MLEMIMGAVNILSVLFHVSVSVFSSFLVQK